MRIEYVGTEIEELSVKKDISEDVEINLQTNTSFTVYYSDDGNSCFGEFKANIYSQYNPEQLTINYCSKSFFNMYGAETSTKTEEEIHEEIFERIFPMCNETIKQFTSMVGLPNISLVDMEASSMAPKGVLQ